MDCLPPVVGRLKMHFTAVVGIGHRDTETQSGKKEMKFLGASVPRWQVRIRNGHRNKRWPDGPAPARSVWQKNNPKGHLCKSAAK
jgi:hypothetical protein